MATVEKCIHINMAINVHEYGRERNCVYKLRHAYV